MQERQGSPQKELGMTQPRNIVRAALLVAVIVLTALPGAGSSTKGPAVTCVAPSSPSCASIEEASGSTATVSTGARSDGAPRSGHSGVGLRGIVLLAVAALASAWLLGARVRRWMVGI
jgi:hypothetical protein